jgi:peroxiredoxin
MEFSELEMDFRECGTMVFGISRDNCMVYGSFRDKHGLADCCRTLMGKCAAATGCLK